MDSGNSSAGKNSDDNVSSSIKTGAVDPMSMIDIDKILDSIPGDRKGRRYADGWDPNHLDEELKKHPFFLKDAPSEGEEVSPLVEALQQLKYSPDENTPEELAKNYKEDGLFHYKLKKYRIAVLCFTEGIKSFHSNIENHEKSEIVQNDTNELEAQLYNNRAASQFHLQNFRSALLDCEKACTLKKDYFKAIFKGLECCVKLGRWDQALEYCTKCEMIDHSNKQVAKLRVFATTKSKQDKASGRKSDVQILAQEKTNAKIMSYIAERKIKCLSNSFLDDDSAQHKVKIGADDRLEWPVIFFYPQFSQSDFIESFHEDSTFLEHLTEILENERPPWDRDDEYHIGTVQIYFLNNFTGGYVQVNIDQRLGSILQDERFQLPPNGISGFFIMNPSNGICKSFLEQVPDSSGNDSS